MQWQAWANFPKEIIALTLCRLVVASFLLCWKQLVRPISNQVGEWEKRIAAALALSIYVWPLTAGGFLALSLGADIKCRESGVFYRQQPSLSSKPWSSVECNLNIENRYTTFPCVTEPRHVSRGKQMISFNNPFFKVKFTE